MMIQHLARGASQSLLWFVLGFMPFIVCAQTRYPLTGRITDAAHQPLPYATVAVEGETFGTYSDEAGNYVLTLPVGTYTIVYSSVGYETLRLKCS
ncbi:MAG: carboxypeptidase-like regulatory domain-containing protein, partial [bacterium]|nr:carboxypeptidase-like regulatory domain-containing protein [bacterium]